MNEISARYPVSCLISSILLTKDRYFTSASAEALKTIPRLAVRINVLVPSEFRITPSFDSLCGGEVICSSGTEGMILVISDRPSGVYRRNHSAIKSAAEMKANIQGSNLRIFLLMIG